MRKMKDCVNAVGGIIAIDRKGNFGKAFNTKKAVWATIKNDTLESGTRTKINIVASDREVDTAS